MKYKKLLIIDGSYMIHRSLKVPDLWDLRDSQGRRSGGIFGFLNSLRYVMREHPSYYPVVTWDRGQSSRRLSIYPKYKNNHLKMVDYLPEGVSDEEFLSRLNEKYSDQSIINEVQEYYSEVKSKPPVVASSDDDYVTQYRTQRDDLIHILGLLGIPSIKVKGWEGDDLITLLTRISVDSYVVTDDRDMIQLLRPDIGVVRPLAKEVLHFNQYLDDNDMESIREMILIKAIVGDGSDAIPGITDHESERKYRVGAVRASKLAKILRSHDESVDLCRDQIKVELKNPGLGFLRNVDKFRRNLSLVDLSLVPDDPDVYSYINHEIQSALGSQDLLKILSALGSRDITTIDYNSIIQSLSDLDPRLGA